jgi:hypothetical protein
MTMKKLFIAAVLMAALGGALYYYFEMRSSKPSPVSFKEQLTGTWKIDSVALSSKDSGNVIGLMIMALDSNYLNYTYTFAKDDVVEKKLDDSVVEKLNYKLHDPVQLTFIAADSSKEEFNNTIVSFDSQQFTLRASDSTLLFFKRN